jgi:hypothetical protein
MPAVATVTEYLERARKCAALADRKSGEQRKRLLAIAEAWLRLAEDAAAEAITSAPINSASQQQPKPH